MRQKSCCMYTRQRDSAEGADVRPSAWSGVAVGPACATSASTGADVAGESEMQCDSQVWTSFTMGKDILEAGIVQFPWRVACSAFCQVYWPIAGECELESSYCELCRLAPECIVGTRIVFMIAEGH